MCVRGNVHIELFFQHSHHTHADAPLVTDQTFRGKVVHSSLNCNHINTVFNRKNFRLESVSFSSYSFMLLN